MRRLVDKHGKVVEWAGGWFGADWRIEDDGKPEPPVFAGAKRGGGIGASTKAMVEILAGYCHACGLPEAAPSQRKLAELAIAWAAKNGWQTDGLEIDSGTVRAVCQAFIDGIKRAT